MLPSTQLEHGSLIGVDVLGLDWTGLDRPMDDGVSRVIYCMQVVVRGYRYKSLVGTRMFHSNHWLKSRALLCSSCFVFGFLLKSPAKPYSLRSHVEYIKGASHSGCR